MTLIDIAECFDVLTFLDENIEGAQARFRDALNEIGWSDAARAVIETISDKSFLSRYSAIHIRAGDIVTGDWRHFVPVEKYMPMAYVEFAIKTLSGSNGNPIVVLSDNDKYVGYLKSRFDVIRTPGDLVTGYADLTELQRAFADILVLSRARCIAGPNRSAFSRLAANLGGLKILTADRLMMENHARHILRNGIARVLKEAKRLDVLRPLLARDICWFLDVFSENLALKERIALAHQAVKLEPDFCGGLNRLGLGQAQTGKRRESEKASLQARRTAARVDCHADPMVESLATSVAAGVLAFGTQRSTGLELIERLGLGSIVRLFERALMVSKIKADLDKCEALSPFQIHHHDVLLNLRFQVAALAWLGTADVELREAIKASLRSDEDDSSFLSAWRPSGFSMLCGSGSFPQVLRNLEVVTIRIARIVGAALSSTATRSPQLFNVDAIRTSASGLQWVHGCAYDAERGRSELAVSYFFDGAFVSGGVNFIARPDVAEALKDLRALNCGFAFPVPLDVQDEVGILRSNIRFVDTA